MPHRLKSLLWAAMGRTGRIFSLGCGDVCIWAWDSKLLSVTMRPRFWNHTKEFSDTLKNDLETRMRNTVSQHGSKREGVDECWLCNVSLVKQNRGEMSWQTKCLIGMKAVNMTNEGGLVATDSMSASYNFPGHQGGRPALLLQLILHWQIIYERSTSNP